MRLIYALIPLFLVACGGGSNTPTDGSSGPVDINQQAKLTESSAVDFHVSVKERFSKDLTKVITAIFLDGELLFQTGSVDLMVLNACGGTKHITGSLNETNSSGTLNITFTDFSPCFVNGFYSFSGDVTVDINDTEIYVPGGNITIPSDYMVTTSNLSYTFGTISFGIDGAIEYSHDTTDPDFNTITLIKNMDIENSEGKATFQNFVYKKHYSSKDIGNLSGYWSYSFSGRLYDSDHGYVDVTTINAPAACATVLYPSECPLDTTAIGRIEIAGDSSTVLIRLSLIHI